MLQLFVGKVYSNFTFIINFVLKCINDYIKSNKYIVYSM